MPLETLLSFNETISTDHLDILFIWSKFEIIGRRSTRLIIFSILRLYFFLVPTRNVWDFIYIFVPDSNKNYPLADEVSHTPQL
jgi:hypothetical protein